MADGYFYALCLLLRGKQNSGGRRQPTLKRVGLKQGRFIPRCKQSRYNSFFEVGFIPTTEVFIDTSFLLPSAFILLPFFVRSKKVVCK